MDVSKLPKLSQTPAPPPTDPVAGVDGPPPPPAIAAAMSARPEWCRKCHAPNAPNSRFCASCGAGLGGPTGAAPVEIGAEAWISVAVGLLLLLMNPMFIKFLFAPKPYTPFVDPTINYADSINFWSDLVITAFALVLIVEGVAIVFARRPWVVLFAFFLTVATTIANLLYLVTTYGQYGLALYSALAVAFGVYIALYQWRLYQSLRLPTL